MAVSDRLMGWDVGTLALYADTADPSTVNLSDKFYDLLGIFTSFRLRVEDETREGRATSELWKVPLYISSGWTIEVNTVVDSTTKTMTWVRLSSGAGPYWVQIANFDGSTMYGRVRFDAHELHLPMGAQEEVTLLRGVGPLTPGVLGAS